MSMPDKTVESFEASPQQERLWAIEPDGPTARFQAVLAIDGALDAAALSEAVRQVVRRHEVLRTTFLHQTGLRVPVQAVNDTLEPRIDTLDLSTLSAEEREQKLERIRRAELEAAFDFQQGPLVRAALVVGDEDAHTLILTVSALCADPASTALFFSEIASQLGSGELVQDPLQYADFSAWQHELSASDEDEAGAARAFWEEMSSASSPVIPFTRTAASPESSQQIDVEIGDELAGSLTEQAARYGAPPAALAQAAWQAVLGRFSGEESTTVAFVAGDRRHSDLEGALGAFARPVPIEARVDAARTFAEVLAQVDRARIDALSRQDYAPAGAAAAIEIGFVEFPSHIEQPEGLSLKLERMICAGPEHRLVLICGTDGDRLTLTVSFDRACYRRETVSALADGLLRMLEAVAADPSTPLGDVELLSDEERAHLLSDFKGPAADVPRECAHELIARWALSAPDRHAVLDGGGGSITYAELDARANQLANRLRRSGVGPDVAVGLCTDRSIAMVVGLLGILKAGGTYVPLHYEHPPARLAHQLERAGANALVTQESLLGRLPDFDGELVCLDRDRSELDVEQPDAPESGVSHEHDAYVIFTSGSTGAPKGVSVTHGNLANYVADITARLGADSEPLSFGLVTSVSTDLGNTSLFGALCSGGTLVLVSPDAATDPGALAGFMEATPVDILKITPSHIGALLAAGDARVLPKRWLVIGGERAGWDLIDRVRALSSCAILNHYGPTETTIGSCTFLVEDGPGEYEPASVPIGRPISNTACYVLDAGRRLNPIGVPGRLFIGGAGVARGYTGEPELTDERFFADPFAQDGGRMYDTGDLARWLPDGTLEFLGRADEQVKIRGYRVEPAEIETALRAHAEVTEAVTVTQASGGGELRLIAYCTVNGTLDRDHLRVHLSDWLPEFMLPGAIVIVAEFPRTPSGKIDRLQLPDPDVAQAESVEYVAPRTTLEEAVAAIWEQVLGVPKVGVEDDFFALGGHSLLATQVVARVRSDFAVDLPLHSLFTCPTVSSLSAEIVQMMGDSELDETAKLMADLEGMSDEEAERLLAEDPPADTGQV
jgi:amino acid adenylation domain-containing protein